MRCSPEHAGIGPHDDPPATDLLDLFPDGWGNADSRRLAAMAGAAWVLGGMGSWNDLGFSDADRHREYDQVSQELFTAVMHACVASVNSEPSPVETPPTELLAT